MSSHSRIGLSDTQFDAELRCNEIDHDFFDNPCGGSTSQDGFRAEVSQREGTTATAEIACPQQRFQLNFDITATRDKGENNDDLVTPDTCVASPHATPFSNFFNSGVEGHESGPHSSYLMMNGINSHSNSLEMNTALLMQPIQEPRQALSDLSSSSSDDDSESEGESDGRILDTEDEEFVDLLEKYYDYIDLGESDNSDLTEVSPMSSFSASPHPSFCPSNVLPETTDHADPVYKVDDKYRPVNGICRSAKLPQTKPLPPLIIHTLEEIPIIRPRPATFAQGFIIPHSDESLLMKVNSDSERPSTSVINRKGSADSEIKPTSSSSMSTSNSSSSFQNKSESNSIQPESSISDPISFNSFVAHELRFNQTENGTSPRKLDRKSADSIKNMLHCNQMAHVKGTIHHHRFGYHHHQPVKASATIARQRQQRRIDHENSILVRRLQSVKPSKEIVEAFRSGTNNLKCTF